MKLKEHDPEKVLFSRLFVSQRLNYSDVCDVITVQKCDIFLHGILIIFKIRLVKYVQKYSIIRKTKADFGRIISSQNINDIWSKFSHNYSLLKKNNKTMAQRAKLHLSHINLYKVITQSLNQTNYKCLNKSHNNSPNILRKEE